MEEAAARGNPLPPICKCRGKAELGFLGEKMSKHVRVIYSLAGNIDLVTLFDCNDCFYCVK